MKISFNDPRLEDAARDIINDRWRRRRIFMATFTTIGMVLAVVSINPKIFSLFVDSARLEAFAISASLAAFATIIPYTLSIYAKTGFNKQKEIEDEKYNLLDRARRRESHEEESEDFNEYEILDEVQRRMRSEADRKAPIDTAKMYTSAEMAEVLKRSRRVWEERSKANERKDMLAECKRRLVAEVKELGFRGNINLIAGASISLAGLILLAIIVYADTAAAKDMWNFVAHFIPRVTLVLMIELFAFFFLSVYKSSLQEIKYFQNEITNIEAKHAALMSADREDLPTYSKLILLLGETERNHIINKDQTTVELEKVRIEKASSNEVMKVLTDLIPKMGKDKVKEED